MFGWGGVFRTCDIKQNSLKIRVNGAVDIIQGPSNELLYKWYKRNTQSVFEFPTWEKNKIIVISPSEVGLAEWLANQASVSTLDISLETSYSALQLPEVDQLTTINSMEEAGYNLPDVMSKTTDMSRIFADSDKYQAKPHFAIESEMFPDALIKKWDSKFYLTTSSTQKFDDEKGQIQPYDPVGNEKVEEIHPYDKRYWARLLGDTTFGFQNDKGKAGRFRIARVNKTYVSWKGAPTYWIKVQPEYRNIETTQEGHVIIWGTLETHIFQPPQIGRADDGNQYIYSVPWTAFIDDNYHVSSSNPRIVVDEFTKSSVNADAVINDFWADVEESVASLECQVHFKRPNDTYVETLRRHPSFKLNYRNPEGQWTEEQYYFNDAGRYTQRLWSFGRQAHLFHLAQSEEDAFDLTIYGENDGNTDYHPHITQEEMEQGWRFAKLTDPNNEFVYDDYNVFDNFPFKFDSHEAVPIQRPRYITTLETDVVRGVGGTLDHLDYQYIHDIDHDDDRARLYLITPATDADALSAVNQFDFQLNVLFEYNNETVLLSQERGKPVHFPNLMLPQSRTALPSQEDAYLTS